MNISVILVVSRNFFIPVLRNALFFEVSRSTSKRVQTYNSIFQQNLEAQPKVICFNTVTVLK